MALTAPERAALLGIARAAIRAHLGLGPAPELPRAGALGEERGAFVTLHRAGELRGCVGTFTPKGPLSVTVAEMAVAAASDDPRFPAVVPEEVDELEYHVSALSPRRRVKGPADIEVGRHGLVIAKNWHRGTLLPRVAVEQGWDARQFLKHTCLKAGLPAEAWEEPDAVIEVFEAEEFGEGEG